MAISQIINVIVNSRGAVTVKKQLSEIGDSAKTTTTYLNSLRGILAAALTFSGVGQITAVVDSFTQLQNRLKLVSENSQEVASNWMQLVNIANNTYSTIDSTVTLYFRVAQAFKSWGNSAQDAMKFTDLFQKSAVLSGSSMQTTAQAVYQFSQALNKGKLDGDEFKSVLEGLPYVANLIQKSFGVTRAELYEMSESGKISVERLKQAFEDAADTISADFSKLAPTVGMALNVLSNNWTDFIGGIQTSTGIFSLFASLILLVANNFGLLAIALIPVAASLAFLGGRLALGLVVLGMKDMMAAIRTLIPIIVMFNATLWANPLVIIVGLITTIILGIVYFRNELGLTNEVLLKIWETVIQVFNSIWTYTMSILAPIAAVVVQFGAWIIAFLRIKEITSFLYTALIDLFTGSLAAAKQFASYLSKTLPPVFMSIIGLVKNLFSLFKAIAELIIHELSPGIKAIGIIFKIIWVYIGPALQTFITLLATIIQGWVRIGQYLKNNLGPIIKDIFGGWIKIINNVISFVAKLIQMLEKVVQLMKAARGAGGGGGGGGLGANYGAQFYAGEFNSGGGFKVPGTGAGRDSTPVNFRANRGERVTVETKRQQRQNDNQPQATNVNVPVSVVNVLDPSMVPAANGTVAGRQSIINAIKADRDEIASILGVL